MAVQARSDLAGLKMLVAGMGVLIVLGTALVIGIVIHRMISRPVAVNPPVAMNPTVAATLAPGEHVGAIAAAGPDLAILVTGPRGERVLLLDPESGRLTTALAPAP